MANKKKTRMYEPWGYQEENNYQGGETILDNDLESFFAGTSYNKDDNKIYFTNKDGEVKASLDVNEFVKSDSIIDHTEYKDGILKIYFTNGDVVTIDLTELLDENEFKDGLIVDGHVVKVLIDGESDKYVSVSENGIKVAGIEADIEAEEARAISAETALDEKIDAEIARATSAETALDEKIDDEIARATSAETALDAKIDSEIARAKAAEDAEKERAEAAEAALSRRNDTLNDELDAEKTIRESEDAKLDRKIDKEIDDREADVDEEEARAIAAEEALQNAIDSEVSRATSAETELQTAIESEGQRAQDAETVLNEKIDAETERAEIAESAITEAVASEIARVDQEIASLNESKFDNVIYDSVEKKIFFYADNTVKGTVDTTDFVKDGMIDEVKIENGKLVIVFNTDAGKETIEIPLSDIFNPDNYYDKDAIDDIVSGINASISEEAATRGENDAALEESIENEKTRAEGVETALQASIEAESARAISAETDLTSAIELKADKETTYTQEEVDVLIKAKETEIYNLTKIVGDMGGNVVYNYPNDLGTSLTTLLSNNGTVKLGEDATITRFGPGIFAKNKVKLNLNNHNLTSTSAGDYGAIMTRGTQEITIYGKGTIYAGGGICIEANSKDSIINLTGSTTIYENDRSGGELIYCYDGTINITNGTFRNNGEDKKFMLNCYDANYRAGTAKIVVTGGKFYDFNPADNSAEGPNTNFLAEGYHTEASTVVEEGVEHTVYTVKKDA